MPLTNRRHIVFFQILFIYIFYLPFEIHAFAKTKFISSHWCRPSTLISSDHSQLASSLKYDATLSDKSFSELYEDCLPKWLLENCAENGFERPTLIQKRSLDSFFEDNPNSMVIQAQTGSGKTLTYLLPLLSNLENRASVQAMIVVPTRELGLQVATIAKRLIGRRFMVMSLLQGSKLKRQRAWAWAETPQVVIGTPTELLDMVQYGGIPRISSIKTVVVDEVDACLMHASGTFLQGKRSKNNNGSRTLSSSLHLLLSKFLSPTFADEGDIEDDDMILLVDDTNKKQNRKFRHRRTIFCSATIPQHRYFLKQCKANQWTLEEPLYICTSPGEALPPTLKHAYMVCQSKKKKLATLRNIIKKIFTPSNKVLIFFDSSRPLDVIARNLAEVFDECIVNEDGKTHLDKMEAKPAVSILRYEDSLSQRADATLTFRDGSDFHVMLTTDLAARGLDITGVSHVIHFDLPPDADSYLHRSGRAGRLGTSGQVISILTNDQEFVLNRLTNELCIDAKCIGRQKAKKEAS